MATEIEDSNGNKKNVRLQKSSFSQCLSERKKMKKLAILGLANAGKSTLFNALLAQNKAKISNYPFCTIKPNLGLIEVPDQRLTQLQKKLNLLQKIPTPLEILDLAGLIQGAHKGEGLGNQFLAEARTASAFLFLIRGFTNPKIIHHANRVAPEKDFEILILEIFLKDLEQIDKILNAIKKEQSKNSQEKTEVLKKIKTALGKNLFPQISLEEKAKIEECNLLSIKPFFVVLNIEENQLRENGGLTQDFFQKTDIKPIPIAAKLELEIINLSPKERKEYLKLYRLEKSALKEVITRSYQLLNLISFYTLTPDLVQAWPIEKSASIKEAAHLVHTDFGEGFKKGEQVSWSDLIKISSWSKAKEKGKIQNVGANYQVKDGDVLRFII